MLIGSANPDKDGNVNYKAFASKVKDMIDGVFSLVNLSKISAQIAAGTVWMDQAEDCGITNLELFSNFKKFDRNLNGVLEMNEYIECLRSMSQEFSE